MSNHEQIASFLSELLIRSFFDKNNRFARKSNVRIPSPEYLTESNESRFYITLKIVSDHVWEFARRFSEQITLFCVFGVNERFAKKNKQFAHSLIFGE